MEVGDGNKGRWLERREKGRIGDSLGNWVGGGRKYLHGAVKYIS